MLRTFGVGLDLAQVQLQVGVSVGVGVRQIDRVISVREFERECEREVIDMIASFDVILIVANRVSATLPTDARFFRRRFRVHQRPHAIVVQRVDFGQIDKVELVGHTGAHVAHAEIKPLRVSTRVDIGFDNHVVLVLEDLDGASQVARLEARLEL